VEHGLDGEPKKIETEYFGASDALRSIVDLFRRPTGGGSSEDS
jgi:hypothetical protein